MSLDVSPMPATMEGIVAGSVEAPAVPAISAAPVPVEELDVNATETLYLQNLNERIKLPSTSCTRSLSSYYC
jgi:hypothetical protein